MGRGAFSPGSTVVLTTHERYGYFSSVLGDGIDAHFDPLREPALDDLLYNISISGGRLVVIDEAHFLSATDMISGLERFVDNNTHPGCLDFIVVCSQRHPGDRLLAHLVTYCQICNVIYEKKGVDISIALSSAIHHIPTRSEVSELVECARWSTSSVAEKNPVQNQGEYCLGSRAMHQEYASSPSRCEFVFDANQSNALNIQIQITTKSTI